MNKKNTFLVIIILFSIILFVKCTYQKKEGSGSKTKNPKLVVGIVVDQMRYDYLYRYWNKYGNGGFKRLLREGYLCANTNINYVPTYTGPGHSAIYTGTAPQVNGIVANNWFDRKSGKSVYCVADKNYNPVGSANKKDGQMSPNNLLTTTITDELRHSDNFKSKVIGISMKDRGSILPAGHSANAAYWYDGESGNWITSTYYMDSLPDWVNKFNAQRQPVKFLRQVWNPILPIDKYTESTIDNTEFVEPFKGETAPVFPYNLWRISENNYDLLRETPFGDTYTKNFAEEAIKKEKLGNSEFTDFLAISFSSPDYIGHRFGINAIETEDTYIRLDKDIEEFLDFLDHEIGKDNILVFLTADHGAVNNPNYLKSTGIKQPGGLFNLKYITDTLVDYLSKTYKCTGLIRDYENQQLYLDYDSLKARSISLDEITYKISEEIRKYLGVALAEPEKGMEVKTYSNSQLQLVQRGYMASRSGDIAIILQPGWIEYKSKGTTHGSGYPYDTHIPLIFYGWKIKPGCTYSSVSITDIAPTLAAFLQIQPPSGCTGKPISGLVN